jgi:RNA polymerase sigma-70 factor, ECF subfamily
MALMGDGTVVVSGSEDSLPSGGEERPDFEGFFEEHHTPLFRALWLVTRNRYEAEEVMQDSFLRIWERWDRVGSLSDPVGYLYRTAMNVFRSRVRRAKAGIRLAVGHLPADDELAKVEEREDIVRALAPLTPRQRAALVLTDLLGLTSEEAAEALRIKASTVRVLVARARAALRKELSERND